MLVALTCLVLTIPTQTRFGWSPVVATDEVAPSITALSTDAAPSVVVEDPLIVWERALQQLIGQVASSVVTVEASRRPVGLDADSATPSALWMSVGSGVCIRSDGSILTSQHIIERASAIYVVLQGGQRAAARLIASDRRSDFAVIRIDGGSLPSVTMGDAESLQRGAFVLTMGNPLGLAEDGHAVASHGMISALRRPLPDTLGQDEDRYFGEMLVTNLTAASGSSGGPLFDARGNLIGIMTAVFSRAGESPAFSFATPFNQRNREIVERLLAGQVVEYGYLGVEVEGISDRLRASLGLRRRIGIRIASVFADGPADAAGVRVGDIVIGVDGHTVASVDQFIRLVGAGSVGQIVKLEVRRGEASRYVSATLTRRPDLSEPALPIGELSLRGATLGPLSPVMRAAANLPENSLLVVRVDADSAAARANLLPGDVVVRVNGLPVDVATAETLIGANGDLVLGLANGGTVLLKPDGNR